MKRIPTLDGWRGIAIALVLFDHVQNPFLHRYLAPWTISGQHGVTIFFVLSGFLITTNLVEKPSGLRRFYIRRFFRLMPVAWCYLAVFWTLSQLFHWRLYSFPELVSCVLFFRNYFGETSTMAVSHYWSLSVEEQFYLVWPGLLALIGNRNARLLAGVGALACALYRFHNLSYYDRLWFDFETQVRADALLVGCLLALMLTDPRIRPLAARWSRAWSIPAALTLLICMALFHWLPPLAENVAIAALIAFSTLHPDRRLARALQFPPLVWLGTVSYSVYIWQQFFFMNRGPNLTIQIVCVMPAAALASYYLLERPAIRLGHRLTRDAEVRVEAPGALTVSTG